MHLRIDSENEIGKKERENARKKKATETTKRLNAVKMREKV